jgi:hypothetical protein
MIVHLAKEATDTQEHPADAAALLVDAAAMCAAQCRLPLLDLIGRLERSHEMLLAADEAVELHGPESATRKQ